MDIIVLYLEIRLILSLIHIIDKPLGHFPAYRAL